MAKQQPEPRGETVPIFGLFNPMRGHPDNAPGHITGRDDGHAPKDEPGGPSIWPF